MLELSSANLMVLVFVIGYALITLEHFIKINKTTTALMMAVICWVIQFGDHVCPETTSLSCLGEHISNISQIVFFLLGALTIVEIVSIHQGFKVISDYIRVTSKRKLLWVMGFVAFFLSAILDNLTTTIVMITLLQKLMEPGEDRLLIGGGIVIAANAGGAWTPIGDVTTTMLWIGGQLSTGVMIRNLFIPSIVCFVASFACLSTYLKGHLKKRSVLEPHHTEPLQSLIFYLGVGVLVFVPVFKMLTGLPPFMGVLFGVSILWIVTDLIHNRYEDRDHLKVPTALGRVDLSSTLFFLGILLAVDALDTAGLLKSLAVWLTDNIGNTTVIATLIGLVSAIVDNVPLVAASMGMYDLSAYPTDSQFWNLVAFCAGTGGSILIIGSAAGVVYMGLEKVDFFWYLKRISLAALIGYFAGIGTYLALA